jgi:hypothetical protein
MIDINEELCIMVWSVPFWRLESFYRGRVRMHALQEYLPYWKML